MVEGQQEDGRRARRERNRAAIIDAMFGLVQDGKVPPSVDDVAARAGVSVSSVFRNFDGLADLQHRALESFQARYSHLLVVDDAARPRAERIRSHVERRVELYEAAGALMRVGRARALDHEPMVQGIASIRARLAAQTTARFSEELTALTPVESANLSALIDATTSPEAYEVLGAAHARTPRQIRKLWTSALDAVLGAWAGDDSFPNEGGTSG